ncbi:MAG: hypothetical protein R3F50_10545 [Gammaproteobacteria bacterium]
MAFVKETQLTDEAYGAGRRRYFLRTALFVLLAGVVYTLLQPRLYMSSASVLMSAPAAIDQSMLEADVQSIAIQGRILTGSEITLALAEVMSSDFQRDIPPLELRSMLEITSVPETNLLELRAISSDAALLPPLVESWVRTYEEIRSRDIEQLKSQTLLEVGEELAELDARLSAAREALADFREENGIISVERQQNAVMSQLEGLNRSLNNAVEGEISAKAYLDTLESAVEAGEQFVPESEQAAVAALRGERNTLEARLDNLLDRYTEDYIRKDPNLRDIPQRIRELETALAIAYTEGTGAELENARRRWERARQSVTEIKQRLEDQREAVTTFNTIYAEHDSLAKDLARLEELNRATLARQVQIEVRQTEKYPQMSVIEWPLPEAQRIGPPYLLLIGGSAGIAIILGIFAAWLYSYLHPRATQPAYLTLSGVHLYPQDTPQALAAGMSPLRLEKNSTQRIEHQPDKEDQEPDDDDDPRKPT